MKGSQLEEYSINDTKFNASLEMELTGVEPVSASSSNIPFIHRLSLSDPQGGNRHLIPDGRMLR